MRLKKPKTKHKTHPKCSLAHTFPLTVLRDIPDTNSREWNLYLSFQVSLNNFAFISRKDKHKQQKKKRKISICVRARTKRTGNDQTGLFLSLPTQGSTGTRREKRCRNFPLYFAATSISVFFQAVLHLLFPWYGHITETIAVLSKPMG